MGNCMNKRSSSNRRPVSGRNIPEVRTLNYYFNREQQFSGPNGDIAVVLRNQTNAKALGDHHNNPIATFATNQRFEQSTSNSMIQNHHLSALPLNDNHNPANIMSNGISQSNNNNNNNNNILNNSNANNNVNSNNNSLQNHHHTHHQQQLHFTRQSGPASNSHRLFITLYDYEARTPEDLRIQKGELLEIIGESNDEWWLAKSQATGQQGFIPRDYVARYNSIEAEPWYFGKMRRVEADKRLLMPENQHGAFIIRDSESKENDFSLSVKDGLVVKHYRIRQADSGGFFITKKTIFDTLQDLVKHYSDTPDGLCVNLRLPCLRIEKPVTNDLSHKTKDDWEIDRRSLTFLEKLGSGQFGQVYEGRWNNVTAVAIKTLKEGSMDKKDFLAEATIMKDLKHPKLIKLYAVCTQEEPILIVTELMRNGCLLDYLQTPAGKALDLRILVNMAEQIATGMAYLEKKNYVHRDLAARNILVGERNIVKVADFGLARLLIDEGLYEAKVGSRFPIKWTAPEAASSNKFSTKSDVWSFGILLTELVTYGRVPYPGMTNSDVLQQVEKGMRMSKESLGPNCTDQLYAIMMECWHKDPKKRLTFESLQWKLDELFDTDSSEYRDAGMISHRNR